MKMNERQIEERIFHEERVYEGNLVKVNRLDVILPDGKEAMREAVRHPGAAAIVPVDENGDVTLVRQYRAPIAQVLLEIPAGSWIIRERTGWRRRSASCGRKPD